jgi:hypothetical protein
MSRVFYRSIAVFSIIALLVAFGISVAGAVVQNSTNRYQPAAEIFAYSAAIVGVFTERLARQSEARQQTISSIAAELKANEGILDDKAFGVDGTNAGRPHIYPRLRISAVDDAFANTRVSLLNDADLVEKLREWRDKISDFNRRLDITELRGFTVADVTERGDMHRRLVQQSGWLAELRADLGDLQQHLCDRHERYLPKQHDHVTVTITASAAVDVGPGTASAAADAGA